MYLGVSQITPSALLIVFALEHFCPRLQSITASSAVLRADISVDEHFPFRRLRGRPAGEIARHDFG